MAVQHTIRAVERHDKPPHWRVFFDIPGADGPTVHCHAFPQVALLWRAAEYGIDPADSRTLLQVVLHEQHMSGHDHTSPDFLYNCDQDTARKALLERVGQVMSRVDIQDPHGHLDQIHLAHTVDPEDFDRRERYIAYVRQHGHHQSMQPEFIRGVR